MDDFVLFVCELEQLNLLILVGHALIGFPAIMNDLCVYRLLKCLI